MHVASYKVSYKTLGLKNYVIVSTSCHEVIEFVAVDVSKAIWHDQENKYKTG